MYFALSLRYLRQRRARALLIIVSIALGVGTLVATRTLSRTLIKAGQQAVNPLAGIADLQISNGSFGVPKELVDELRQAAIPGVATIRPLVVGHVNLADLNNAPALLLGVTLDPTQTSENPWGLEVRLTNPLALIGGKGAFLGRDLAASLPERGHLRVQVDAKEEQLLIAGTIDAHGPAAALGGRVIIMRQPDAAVLLGRMDRISRLDVTLQPGADVEDVRQRMTSVVAGKADVQTPQAAAQGFQDVIAGLELGLSLNGAGALIIGLFLVYNALAVSVTERRHDIGVLRAVGATRGQVAGLFALEAGLLGLAGSAVGVPLGLGLVYVALQPLQDTLRDVFGPLTLQRLDYGPETLLGAAAAGVATALAAALVPALQAAYEQPADAVRRVPLLAGWRTRLLQILLCASTTGIGLLSIALRETLPRRVGTFVGVSLLFLGILLAMPLIAPLVAHLLKPLIRRLFGMEGRLAADNLARSPGRTGLVVAALAAGVALVMQTAGVIRSSQDGVLAWFDESLGSDLFITAHNPVSSGGQGMPMRDTLGKELAALDGVEAALPIRTQQMELDGVNVFLLALDAPGFYTANQKRPWVVGREKYALLFEPGACLVSENFAALRGAVVGTRLTFKGPRGPVELHVVGFLLDYSWNRGSIFMDLEQYRQRFEDRDVDIYDLYLRDDANPETVREQVLRRYGASDSLVVLTRPELRQRIAGMIRRLHSIAYAQELVGALVAGLGVVTALLISILQRRRELGLLRALGATQTQVVRCVLAEALLMGLIGGVVGLVLGLPLTWFVVRVLLFDESGFLLPVQIPWGETSLLFLLTVVMCLLAGLGPALHALRLEITEAIAWE